MNDLWQQFTDTLVEGIRAKRHPDTISDDDRKALERMNALCDEIEERCAALPQRYLDDYVQTRFKKTKSHPQDIYVLTFGALWPTDGILAAFRRQGFQVAKTGRVFATPTLAERKRRALHFRVTWRREKLLRKYLRICEELLNDGE